MVVATIAVHAPNGIWNQNGWVEFTVTNIAIAQALAFVGSGAWSLDATLGLDRTCMGSGAGWGRWP